MQTGADGLAVIKHIEACVLHAYPDPGSSLAKAMQAAGIWRAFLAAKAEIPASMDGLNGAPWTIGWGDTGRDVVRGMVITQAEADKRLTDRLARDFEPAVRGAVYVALTQRQFDALVSITYNVGPGGPNKDGIVSLRNGYPSTLIREVNDQDWPRAADQFLAWVSPGSTVEHGLRRRRTAERWLFLGKSAEDAIELGDLA